MVNGYSIYESDFSIIFSGKTSAIDSFKGDHCHECFEINYFASGLGSFTVEGADYLISSGNLLLTLPMAFHRVDLNCECEIWSVRFSKNLLTAKSLRLFERFISDDETSGVLFSPKMYDTDIASIFYRFEALQKMPKEEKGAYFESLLSEVIILLSLEGGESMKHTDDRLGARVMRYLNNNIEKNVSLDKLARRFFVSKYHLCRAFKEYSGISVHSYINHKRIMYAKSLIESGETASGAAEQVGFGDYSAFYRAYVKLVGKSPTA